MSHDDLSALIKAADRAEAIGDMETALALTRTALRALIDGLKAATPVTGLGGRNAKHEQ